MRDVIEIGDNSKKKKKEKAKPLSDVQRVQLIAELTEKMKDAAKNLRFEEAAKYRDRVNALKKF